MNLKNLLAKLSFVVVLLTFLSTTAFAQLQTVYVDYTNGNDVTNSGANPDNSVLNAGPVKTIAQALTLVADNGTISIAASTTGLYEYGAVSITSGKNLTLEARVLGTFTKVSMTSLTINQANYTITLATDGTASFETNTGGITMTAGTLNIPGSSLLTLKTGATVSVVAGASSITGTGLAKGSNLNLTYTGATSATAGSEASFSDYGTGVLTLNNTAGTITFNNSSMAFAGIVVGNNGNATINGNVTLGTGDIVTTAGQTGDLTINGNLDFTIENQTTYAVTANDASATAEFTIGAHTIVAGDVIYLSGNSDATDGYYDVASVTGTTVVTNANTGAGTTGDGNIIIATVGKIVNLGGGVVTVTGTTTWTNDDATNIGAKQWLGYIVDNNVDANTGGISLGAVTINGADKDGEFDAAIYNRFTGAVNGGPLTIGSLSTPGTLKSGSTTAYWYPVVSLINNGKTTTGKFTTGGGDIRGTVTNLNTGSFTFSGAATVTGNFVNTLAGQININAAVTFSGNFTNTSTGKVYVNETTVIKGNFSDGAAAGEVNIASGKELQFNSSANSSHTTATGSFKGAGYVAFYGSKTKTLTGPAVISNIKVDSGSGAVSIDGVTVSGNLTAAASLTLTDAVTVSGATTLSGGTMTFGDGVTAGLAFTVDSFTMTGGTFTVNAGATTTLDVNGDFSRTGGAFSISSTNFTLKISGAKAQAISPGASMKVGNINIDAPTQTITFNNSIEATGNFTLTQYTVVNLGINNITLSGNGAVSTNNGTYTSTGGGGIMFTGNSGRLAGTSAYSNIIVNLSAAAGNVTVGNPGTDNVKWTGQLTLNAGGIDVNATVGDVDLSPSGTSAKIVRNLASANTDISLTNGGNTATFNASGVNYSLEYIGTLAADTPVGSEFNSGTVVDLTINTDNTAPALTQLPNAANEILGNLVVGVDASVDVQTGSLELSKDGGVHSIRGVFGKTGTADELIISGASATLTGYTTTGDPATVENLTINSTTQATVSNVDIPGALSTGASSVATFTQRSTQAVAGLVTLGGSSFTLGSDLEFQAGLTHNKGAVDLGGYDLDLTTGGAYDRSGGDATATYSSTGGWLIFDKAMNADFNDAVIPYCEVNFAVTLLSDVTFSKELNIKAGSLGGAFDVNILDKFTNAVATPIPAGNLILKGTTVTTSSDMTVYNLEIDSDTTSVAVFQSDDETDANPTKRTFTVTNVFTQTLGNANFGMHDVKLTKTGVYAYARTEGNISQTTGAMVFASPSADATQKFDPGVGFSIKNLTINQTQATAGNQKVFTDNEEPFTVTGTLTLTQGVFDTKNAGELHMADNATVSIDRNKATLNDIPTLDGMVNVKYTNSATASTAKELPASNSKLKNLTIANTAGNVTLAANVVVNGKIVLTSGNLDNSAKQVTLVDGGTIERNAGTFQDEPAVTTYILSYTGSVTDAKEFVEDAVSKVIVAKNQTWTLGGDRTIGALDLSASGSVAAAGVNKLTVTGDLAMSAGTITTAAGGSLVLGGTAQQTFTVPSAGYTLASPLTLNNEAGFVLAGGNLKMDDGAAGTSADIVFVNGVFTTGDNTVILDHSTAGMGFDHTQVADTNVSHINGNVKVALAAGDGASGTNGRYEFPVGSASKYRPYALTFNSSNPVINPTSVVVKNVDENPEGTKGLPIKVSDNLSIGSYPNYYWLVKTTPSSFSSQQVFDVEVTGTNIGIPYTSDQDLRILKRQDGSSTSNAWSIEGGTSSIYSNYQVVNTLEDTSATVRTAANVGGLTVTGVRFTIGVPTRAPQFTAPVALTATVAENATLDIQFTADPNDVGETVTYALVNAPAWATINATTGLVTLAPDYTVGSATPYNITVRATDSGGAITDLTIAVTVTNTNRVPSFTTDGAIALADKTVKSGDTYLGGVTAVDADGGTLTYTVDSVTPALAGTLTITGAATGAFEFKPLFGDAGKVFDVVLKATDADGGSATTTAKFTVEYPVALGDVDGNAAVGASDASEILKYVVGLVTFTDVQKYAADVNGDGEVGALDAAWVLYYVANDGEWPTGAKMNAVAGLVDFGQIASENGVINMPINLTATSGVLSAYTEISINDQVEVTGVTARLPEGWTMVQNVANNKIRIAMAGLTPLTEGTYAVVGLKLKDKEAVVNISGLANLNDQLNASLSAKVREVPSEFALSQNYPNPFNPTTTIKFAVAEKAPVTLNIYNMLGQKVKSLVDSEQEAGFYTVNWDGTNDFGSRVASGIYIYRITAGKFTSTMKMNLLK